MMAAVVSPLVLIAGLIGLAGLLSLAECAILGARKSLLRDLSGHGNRQAETALRLRDDSDRVVAALRLGIAFAIALAGLIVGAMVAGKAAVGDESRTAWLLASGVGAAAMLALLTVIFVEALPQRLGQQQPERLACRLAGPTRVIARALAPLVTAADRLARVLLRALKIADEDRPRLAQEELIGLIDSEVDEANLGPASVEIFRRVFRFCDRRARTIMTPRAQVVWIDVADSPEEIRRKVVGTSHSRFPVCDQSLDNLLGIVQAKDLLAQRSEGPMFRLTGHLTLPAFIFEGARGPQILEILRDSSTHIAVVLDEYGSVVGLLTLNDILENVLGNMPEGRGEGEEAPVVTHPDGSRLIDGRLPIDEFRDLYCLSTLPAGDYHTLAGLVVSQLGHIPGTSETLVLQGLLMEVVEVNANRVARVLVRALNGEHTEDHPPGR